MWVRRTTARRFPNLGNPGCAVASETGYPGIMLQRSRNGLRLAGAAAMACALTLTAACATTTVVDGQSALDGKDLETAVSLYGRPDERAAYGGKSFYIWRRAATVEGRTAGCELRAELGYRNMIRQTQLEGFPAACQLFSVQFTSVPDSMRRPEVAAAQAPRLASGCPGCRPVGSPTETASIAQDR